MNWWLFEMNRFDNSRDAVEYFLSLVPHYRKYSERVSRFTNGMLQLYKEPIALFAKSINFMVENRVPIGYVDDYLKAYSMNFVNFMRQSQSKGFPTVYERILYVSWMINDKLLADSHDVRTHCQKLSLAQVLVRVLFALSFSDSFISTRWISYVIINLVGRVDVESDGFLRLFYDLGFLWPPVDIESRLHRYDGEGYRVSGGLKNILCKRCIGENYFEFATKLEGFASPETSRSNSADDLLPKNTPQMERRSLLLTEGSISQSSPPSPHISRRGVVNPAKSLLSASLLSRDFLQSLFVVESC